MFTGTASLGGMEGYEQMPSYEENYHGLPAGPVLPPMAYPNDLHHVNACMQPHQQLTELTNPTKRKRKTFIQIREISKALGKINVAEKLVYQRDLYQVSLPWEDYAGNGMPRSVSTKTDMSTFQGDLKINSLSSKVYHQLHPIEVFKYNIKRDKPNLSKPMTAWYII